jgi:RND family efflux transporter MFP subunit
MKLTTVITVTGIIALCSCSQVEKPVEFSAKSTNETSKFEIGHVTENPLSSYVKLPGQLKPFEEVNIYAKVNGFVDAVLVDRGSRVRKGQVLVRVIAPELESQEQMATSKYAQAQEDAVASREKYRRLKEAAGEAGAVAPLDLDNALARTKADDAKVMAEKSNVEMMRNIKSYLTITAPFDGVIIQRNISAGALVGPGSKSNDQPMLVLQQLKKMRLEVYIPEAYVDQVDLTRRVSFIFNSMPDKELTATISRSANALTSMRSEAIEIDLQNDKQLFKPGMYAEVKVPLLSGSKALLIPNNAIIRSTERQYVITVKEGKTRFVDVKEGLKAKDSTEVFGNLAGGDEILLHATDEIKEGTTIK